MPAKVESNQILVEINSESEVDSTGQSKDMLFLQSFEKARKEIEEKKKEESYIESDIDEVSLSSEEDIDTPNVMVAQFLRVTRTNRRTAKAFKFELKD